MVPAEVAVLPYTRGTAGHRRREAERAAALELLERYRAGTRPGGDRAAAGFTAGGAGRRPRPTASSPSAGSTRTDLLTQPATLRHYRTTRCRPTWRRSPWLGTADDLTGPDRLDEDGAAYFPPPADLPYFYAANAPDPRAGIVHEGAHYQQLALSWRHPRPLRRHYYDSTPTRASPSTTRS